MAAADPPERHASAPDEAPGLNGFHGVLAARGVEPARQAAARPKRPQVGAVEPDAAHCHPGARTHVGPVAVGARSSRRTASRESPSDADVRRAAPGCARTTMRLPTGRPSIQGAATCCSRRRNRLRTGALPTAFGTTTESRAGRASAAAPRSPREVTSRAPRRRRRPFRATRRCSAAATSRCFRGSTKAGRLRAEFLAALAPASRHNGSTCPGAHAEPEAVGLRSAPVVGLVGALGHGTPPAFHAALVAPAASQVVPSQLLRRSPSRPTWTRIRPD